MKYTFSEFEIDVDKYELRRDGTAVHIEPLIFDLLVHLAKNPGRIITRDELVEVIWNGRIISEATISTSIKQARKAIGDSGEVQNYIKTHRGRGIEFMGKTVLSSDIPAHKLDEKLKGKKSRLPTPFLLFIAWSLVAIIIYLNFSGDDGSPPSSNDPNYATPESPYKVAVLPFIDMSQMGDQEYFADGMAEAILNLLASTRGLDMTSRTTAFSLKGQNLSVPEISNRLGVNYIVEGSVRTTGERVRVTAQLIDVNSDAQLWSDTYDRELTSIFEVQDDISLAITDALKVELGAGARNRDAPTTNITAYDLYLRGHQLFLSRGTFGAGERVGYLEESISLLEQATALDPNFAEAWADLAGVSMVIPTFDGINYNFEDMADRSTIFIERALSLDPELSQAWASKGFIHLVRLEFADAEDSLKRATELRNNNETAWLWLGLTYTTVGYPSGAMAAIERAIELAPNVAVNYNVMGAAAHSTGDAKLAADFQHQAVNERSFELGRIDTLLIALDPTYQDPRGRRGAAIEDATRYIDFLEKNSNPDRDRKLSLYVESYLNPAARDDALAQLDLDIEARERSSFIGAYLLGDGTRMARHFELGTENDGLNLRRIYSPVGRPLFQHKAFRDYLINVGMLDYWKTHQFPPFCEALGENDFMCN